MAYEMQDNTPHEAEQFSKYGSTEDKIKHLNDHNKRAENPDDLTLPENTAQHHIKKFKVMGFMHQQEFKKLMRGEKVDPEASYQERLTQALEDHKKGK